MEPESPPRAPNPAPIPEPTPQRGREVVSAAFAVLEALPAAPVPGQVGAIAAATGIPRATVHRLLVQLERAGAVERADARWRPAPRLLRLAYHVDTAEQLRGLAAPVVQELRAQTGATVSLVVPDGDVFVALDMVPGRFDLPFVARSGFVMPEGAAAVQALTRRRPPGSPGSAEDDEAVLTGTTCYAVTVTLPGGAEAALQVATSPDVPARELRPSVHRAAALLSKRAGRRRQGYVG